MRTGAMAPPAMGAGSLQQSLPRSPLDPAETSSSDFQPPHLLDRDCLFLDLPRLGCFVANKHVASSPGSPQIPQHATRRRESLLAPVSSSLSAESVRRGAWVSATCDWAGTRCLLRHTRCVGPRAGTKVPGSRPSPQDANETKGSQETGFLGGPGTGASPQVPRCSHTHPPAPWETYGDDVSLQAVGRVGAFDHGAELGVAHSRLGAGGAHGTWRAGEVEPKERWSRMSRTRYEARLRPWHTAQPRFTGGGDTR